MKNYYKTFFVLFTSITNLTFSFIMINFKYKVSFNFALDERTGVLKPISIAEWETVKNPK